MTTRSRSSIVRLVLAGVALASMVGCGKSSTDVSSAEPLAEPDDLIEISNRGDEPRHALRLNLEKGVKQAFVMKMDLDMEMTFEGQKLPATEIPTTEVHGELSIEEVKEDGTAVYSFTYVKATAIANGADPNVVSSMQPLLDQIAGVKGTVEVTPRGENKSATFDTGTITDETVKAQVDQMTDQITNLTVPFPDQAVGVGARWKATNEATFNGITTTVVTSYRLVKVTSDSYELHFTQDMSAAPGPMDLAALPEGAEATLKSMDMSGRGEMTGSLSRVIATASSTTSGDLLMHVKAGGDEGDMKQHLEITMDIRDA